MKRVSFLAAAVALAALAAPPAGAEPVPARATGIWSVAECGGDAPTMLVKSNFALVFEREGSQTRVAMARTEWSGSSIVLTMNGLTVDGETDEVVVPPLDSLQRCDALPTTFSFMFAEAVTVFGALDAIEARCAGGAVVAARCVALVFDLIDVSEDGEFSKAELSRAVRALSFFVGYGIAVEGSQDAFVPMEKLSVAWFSASLLGPYLAENLIDSYDFDGDGLLSLDELLQDRSPEGGVQGVAAGLAAKMPPAMMSGLMKAVNGMLGALR